MSIFLEYSFQKYLFKLFEILLTEVQVTIGRTNIILKQKRNFENVYFPILLNLYSRSDTLTPGPFLSILKRCCITGINSPECNLHYLLIACFIRIQSFYQDLGCRDSVSLIHLGIYHFPSFSVASVSCSDLKRGGSLVKISRLAGSPYPGKLNMNKIHNKKKWDDG